MPVIVERENWALRLGEAQGEPATLLRPAAEDVLRFWSVDRKVGNVKNDRPELIELNAPHEPMLT